MLYKKTEIPHIDAVSRFFLRGGGMEVNRFRKSRKISERGECGTFLF